MVGKAVACGMVVATLVDVNDTVAGRGAKTNPIEISSLSDQTIGEGMPRFCFPLGSFSWVGVFCPEVVIAMGKQGQKIIIPFLHRLKLS